MSNLFSVRGENERRKGAPLADRMRPRSLAECVGQEKLLGEGGVLRRALSQDRIPSMILWGPPGTGKTTLARIIAHETSARFIALSAVTAGVPEVRVIVREAKEQLELHGVRTIVFVDEIHRFNKAQQDVFLPHVEDGTIALIGATTENPSFEVNAALLSRSRVFVLNKLSPKDLWVVLQRALEDSERGFGSRSVEAEEEALSLLSTLADGDARAALNALEIAVDTAPVEKSGTIRLTTTLVRQSLQKSHLLYDRAGEEHYNIISALHKSMRGSDADAALYWLGRMLEAGEDPLYIARRLIRFASEDVGLADPGALVQAVAAFQAAHAVGMPECSVNLSQAVAYLSQAPKSIDLYRAYEKVRETIQNRPAYPVPLHLRNAPTGLMKELGYGRDSVYPPEEKGKTQPSYLPEELEGKVFFEKE